MDYEFRGGNHALNFTNTLHSYGTADSGDDLKTAADLIEWAVQAGLLSETETRQLGRARADQLWFRRALALRMVLYEIFSRAAEGRKPKPAALLAFQRFYRNAIRQPEFQVEDNHYRVTWAATTHPLERVSQEITRSAADLLTSDALTRVRQCSGEPCSWLFVDTSRNGTRRWCDMKACGNRAKVRRFRRNVDRAAGRSPNDTDDSGATKP